MISVGSGTMMSIGARMLMPIRSLDFLGIQSQFSCFGCTLQKHCLKRVCALDIELDPAIKDVSSNGHQADGEPFDQIFIQNLLQCPRVRVIPFADSSSGQPNEHTAQTASNEVASPKKR